MAERESISSRAAAWAQVVSALVGAVAAGAAFLVGQQSIQLAERQNDDAKTLQTLQFFATFNSQDMLGIRHGLNNEDWCVRYHYVEKEGYQSLVPPEHAFAVVDFFDAVDNSCNQHLCNPEFTQALFGPYAREAYDSLSKFILDNRPERGEAFGQGMAHLAHEDNTPLEQVAARYRQQEC